MVKADSKTIKDKKKKNSSFSWEELIAQYTEKIKPFEVGSTVEGTIIYLGRTVVLLDLEGRGLGMVFGRELGEDYSKAKYKLGDKVLAQVLELEDEEGRVILSLRRVGKERVWRQLEQHFQKGDTLSLKVVEANKGGLLLAMGEIKGFLPVSQLSAKHYPRVEGGDKDKILSQLSKLIGSVLNVKILDLDQKTNKLIFSEKDALLSNDEILSKYKIGERVKGKVTGIVDFGAFVNLGEIEGLVHISEISWDKVENISDYLKVGDEVEVMVIGSEGGKISLSLKRLTEDPWQKKASKYKVGDEVEGEVTKITPFGAFVRLKEGLEGLVHISEISLDHVENPEDVLKVSEKYKFKIISIDPQSHKIALSLKAMSESAKKEDKKVKKIKKD